LKQTKEITVVKISKLKQNPNNPRIIKDEKFQQLCDSLKSFPGMMALRPIVVDSAFIVQGGNMRLLALKELGYKELPEEWVKQSKDLTAEQWKEFVIKDNLGFGEWNWEQLANEWDVEDLASWGLDLPLEFESNSEDEEFGGKGDAKKLVDKFIIPPFSILDTRQGYWQERKRNWLDLGIESEKSREGVQAFDTIGNSDVRKKLNSINNGISIFDPVLCEIIYQWFCPINGTIIDPFAGGSVRGIVASQLGFQYIGVELRKDQIEANRQQSLKICKDPQPVWHCGNSLNIDKICNKIGADLIFSCPPYFDLEVYSDDPEDLSTMDYDKFLIQYREIIKKSLDRLKDNRFACFVVGDIRDKKGFYRNFVSETIMSFYPTLLYNECILINHVGNLGLIVANSMKNRKLGKCHQNVLIFYKGDPKKIKENFPDLDFSSLEGTKD